MQDIGGGVVLMVALLAGALIGMSFGEPSLGLLIGLAVGLAGALVINRRDARRRRNDP